MAKARLIAKTQCVLPGINSGEELITYQARVSNPKGQDEQTPESAESLIITTTSRHHWSVLEGASLTMEVETTRAIAAQILRHKSFSFQEFSQRYASAELLTGEKDLADLIIEEFDPRLQDSKNRQSSIPIDDAMTIAGLREIANESVSSACAAYQALLEKGVAKEVARGILPLNTPTRIYITGNIRSWYFYLLVRNDPATQKEHRDVAIACEEVFKQEFPVVHSCLLNHRVVALAEADAWALMRKAKKKGRAIVGWKVEPIYADSEE
jgi:thymidylate synthase (FAD)